MFGIASGRNILTAVFAMFTSASLFVTTELVLRVSLQDGQPALIDVDGWKQNNGIMCTHAKQERVAPQFSPPPPVRNRSHARQITDSHLII